MAKGDLLNRRSSSRRREPSVQSTLGVSKPTRKRRKETPVEHQQQYVGIDLHRRRSVVVHVAEDGQVLGVDQVVNDPVELSMAVAKAGPDPEVALESTYGWYWAVDALQAGGAQVHLAHPLGVKALSIGGSRTKQQDGRKAGVEKELAPSGYASIKKKKFS